MADEHGHSRVDAATGDRRIGWAVAVNLGLTVVQIVGGMLSGSLSMIADAVHNLSDALSMALAFVARRIARRPADAAMTFGYGRAEVVAALINYTTLIVIALYLCFEAVMRIFEPAPVAGWMVVIVAGVALAVDLVTAALTYAMSRNSINIRAAFLHNLGDALGSVAVIVAGTLILLFGWVWVDPLVTLLIAGYLLWMGGTEVVGVIRILMLGAPPGLDAGKVLDAMRGVEGVQGVHHVHLWQMDERRVALQAHVVVGDDAWARAEAIKRRVKARLSEDFGIAHLTLEMERAQDLCADATAFGGRGDRETSAE